MGNCLKPRFWSRTKLKTTMTSLSGLWIYIYILHILYIYIIISPILFGGCPAFLASILIFAAWICNKLLVNTPSLLQSEFGLSPHIGERSSAIWPRRQVPSLGLLILIYPLVNVNKKRWKGNHHAFLMGKLTIKMAIFNSYFDITRGYTILSYYIWIYMIDYLYMHYMYNYCM